jgi:hypothetical protein
MFLAIRALTWELLAPQRWLLAGLAVYLLGWAAFAQIASDADQSVLCGSLGLPLAALAPFFLGALMHGGQIRLEQKTSGFPARLFTLPVPSAVLALPPLLLGTLVVTLVYLFLAVAVYRPLAAELPLAVPALLLATFIVWLQALIWLPFPIPWLRLVVVVLLLLGAAITSVVLGTVEVPQSAVLAGLAIALAAGYVVGITAVARARHAGTAEPAQSASCAGAAGEAGPFRSPGAALFWYEWRMRRAATILGPPFCVVYCVPLLWLTASALSMPEGVVFSSGLAWFREEAGAGWLTLATLLFIPLMSPVASGPGGTLATNRQTGMSSFLATLPVSGTAFIRAKLWITAVSSLILWATLLLLAAGWVAWTGEMGDMAERLSGWMGGPAPAVLGAGLLLAAGVVLHWLYMVQGLFGGLSGRLFWIWLPMAATLAVWVAGVLGAGWLIRDREAAAVLAEWVLPLLLAGAGGKVLVAGFLVHRLRQRRLVGDADLALVLLAWAGFVAALVALLAWLLPRSALSWPVLVLGVIVATPLGRCLLAPLALAWNRHR